MPKEKIILIGGGGHCRACIDVIEQEGRFEIAGIVERTRIEVPAEVFGYRLLGTDDDLPALRKHYHYALVTVGQIKSPDIRIRLFDRAEELGYALPKIISPLAYVSPHAQVGKGTVVMHHALVNAGARVGRNCIINTKALVEHDTIVGDHSHIATAAIVNGATEIQTGSFVGSNAIWRAKIRIGTNSVVGGGGDSYARHPLASRCASFRIGYFGDGLWAQNALKLFLNDPQIDVRFLVPRYKTPDVRLIEMATRSGIRVLKSANINDPDFISTIKDYDCDLFVSMSFDQIFKTEFINVPRFKTINCHAGKLPFYRGRNILNWVLINDEKEFGITVHYVDEGIDTGDIILQQTYPISTDDTYATILDKARDECAGLLYNAVGMIVEDKVRPVRQSILHPVGMYCTARGPGDEILDWAMTSRDIFNFVRAICEPGPMARTWLGEIEIFVNHVEMVDNAPNYRGIPGAVLFKREGKIYVKTGDSMIKIVDYRKDGRPLRIGDRLQKSPKGHNSFSG